MSADVDFPSDLRSLEADYELIREIGQGGMAAVYLARHRATGRLVAIKAIRARYLDDPDALRRFAREARTVAGLDHPNIVRTEAIEQIGDRAIAIIMEYVPGGTVRDRLREYGAFDAERAESVLRDVATALGYAHRRGIVHRDVKPENVFLDERTGRALLSDFGIARRIEGDVPITLLGAALGTPQYMSPEQIDGGKVDGRTDIYSLGVLGWELLTGRRPWAGENLYGIIYKQKHEELPRITSLRPRVPANLLFAIEGALVKDRDRRWQTTDEFLSHLTYDPPPVLAHSYPAPAARAPDEPTVKLERTEPTRETRPGDARRPRPARQPNARRIGGGGKLYLTRRPFVRALALIVPLLIAGASLYVVFGGRTRVASNGRTDVRSSAGNVALDSARPVDSSVTSRGATSSPPVGRPRSTSGATPRDSTSLKPRSAPKAGAEDPFRPPAAPVRRGRGQPAGTGAPSGSSVPSARCRSAATADQRACLLAYIAINDASLQRVYDSLVAELRRVAGLRRGSPDPPSVTRLRVEQRAWVSLRDRECMSQPRLGRYWAQPASECFARMSAARQDELGEALHRLRTTSR